MLYAAIASSALPLGGWVGAWRPPSRTITAALLAFASGALITAVAFELFEEAFEHGGAWRAGAAFFAGATVFIVADAWLERYTKGRHAAGATVGFALLAGVTLDGNTLAVHVVSGAGHEVVVVDSKKGTILSRVRLKPETP